jgi:WD40 repeat protein
MTVATDGRLRTWRLQEQPRQLEPVLYGFRSGSEYIVTKQNKFTRVWNLQGQLVTQIEERPTQATVFSPSGNRIAAVEERGILRLRDLQGHLIKELVAPQGHSHIAFNISPDGRRLVTASYKEWSADKDKDGNAYLWTADGQLLARLPHQGAIGGVEFSPKGDRFALSGRGGTVSLWTADGRLLSELKGHQNDISSVQFSPDGDRVVTTDGSGVLRVWASNGKLLTQFKEQEVTTSGFEFSPDGKRLITADNKGILSIWASDGKLLTQFKAQQSTISTIEFSPDGDRVVTADIEGLAKIWNLKGQLLAELNRHQDAIDKVQFSPTGDRLVTTDSDGVIKLWSVQGQLLAEFKENAYLAIIHFSPDGKRLTTVNGTGTLKIRRVEDLSKMLQRGCDWLEDYLATHPEDRKRLKVCQLK